MKDIPSINAALLERNTALPRHTSCLPTVTDMPRGTGESAHHGAGLKHVHVGEAALGVSGVAAGSVAVAVLLSE